MEGNLDQSPPLDGWIMDEIPGIVGEVPSDCLATDSMVEESVNTEWTDEKHSSYLNFMEASFVDQLYNYKYHSNYILGWPSRTQKDRRSSGSNVNNLHAGQFKVLRSGCWEKLKFGRVRSRIDIENDSLTLLKNPWIQHFSSPSSGQQQVLTPSDMQENDDISTKASHLRSPRHEVENCGYVRSSKQPSCHFNLVYHQDSVDSSTEMSDQNFVDKDCERTNQVRRTRTKKSWRTKVAVASGKDQIVPFEKSPLIPCSDEFSVSAKGVDGECSSPNS